MKKPTRSPAELRNMFGENLRILSRPHASISELSRQLGINRTQFNRYLSGESFPRPDVLDRICNFFEVDARILLEKVSTIGSTQDLLTGPELTDFFQSGLSELDETAFPSGFYRFSRASFVDPDRFVVGLVYVYREGQYTFVRGYEAKEAMRAQGQRADAGSREFRGYITWQEAGISLVISRKNAMTGSFNFLSRVASLENNFWVGYVTRTVSENVATPRVARLVYEHLGATPSLVFPAARACGLLPEADLPPFHRTLLRPQAPMV
ncbi:XRE family transcriptional regulator [Phaeobacter gallaeciensis]|uniref:XRE family transcriptional regulator n=2 Tax=Roseobacteraceae TaxID=2854170 RepID=A0A366X571_9RHOB|nr:MULTISPECIES: helix-turn-helix transcriptional regulator [Roseobacteraceae]MBT3139910.1 helix-turn-helix domain-containing protein [Falsiruegeria litorea]MBT8170284.1 helix-turn-helix domain-containing protein [Falsiruegeria litorea]RBW56790.1 XRE family transcriptional regulator [Phaeobacter gallaeciensis]